MCGSGVKLWAVLGGRSGICMWKHIESDGSIVFNISDDIDMYHGICGSIESIVF